MAAIKNKVYVFLQRLFRANINLLLILLIPINRVLIKKLGRGRLKHQPIFIVGAPRTGSTALYQALTNSSDVLYIDNLVAKFYRTLFLGFWLSNKVFKNRSHNNFESHYGMTSSSGLRGPNECGQFWYRWLPRTKHFIDFKEVGSNSLKSIKEEITAVTNYFDRPIIFKNLNAGQRLRMIKEAFPDAKIIFITRSPLYTAQSILCAKRKLGIPDNKYWSIMPQNVKELSEMDWPEQISKQVYFIEKQIKSDMKLFPSTGCFTVHYENVDTSSIEQLISKLKLNKRKKLSCLNIKNMNRISLDPSEITLLELECNRLWGVPNE